VLAFAPFANEHSDQRFMSVFAELKRRKVIKVGGAYLVVA
jgi:hypothetical protein